MKKTIAWILGLMLMLGAAAAAETSPEVSFDRLAGLEWSFSSGVGAWSTDLRIQADGSFTGEYHDSEMGETGADYPEGTIYGCSFHGKMSLVEPADGSLWRVRVDSLELDEGQVDAAIEDGVRYVTSIPYGLSAGDEMTLYLPGTPVSLIPEEMLFWAHVMDLETVPDALENWFLCSEQNGSGFVGFEIPEDPAAGFALE